MPRVAGLRPGTRIGRTSCVRSRRSLPEDANDGASRGSSGICGKSSRQVRLFPRWPDPDPMTVALRNPLPPSVRARTVTAVLGPTNTGKTHLAIERMLAHPSGLIGLPLRLLAREVYGKLVEKAGSEAVALVTGEEKIVPKAPRFQVCTVEAMPDTTTASFVAIDEVQLAGDFERGRVFTDRILSLRGRDETLFLGALTARPLLEKLIPGIHVVVRPRMSVLAWTGSKKITRLPARSAIVAFSADEVYAIAELIRRQRGGAAVVLGSLSPRTRNAQVALFQSGDVDFLVATDAIGMGLNLDVEHVAFAGRRKFDGYQYRNLTSAELGQIAGRAGRYTRDGTFGVTGRVTPFEDELVEDLEAHRFAALKMFQWRNSALDFSSLDTLRRSLEEPPREEGLTRAPPAEDQVSLGICRARSRHPCARHGARAGAAAVGCGAGARLSAHCTGESCRSRAGALRIPCSRRPDPRRLVRAAGVVHGSDRRRHRHVVEPDCSYPHVDLYRKPC